MCVRGVGTGGLVWDRGQWGHFLGPSPRAAMSCDGPQRLAPMGHRLFCLRKASFCFSENSGGPGMCTLRGCTECGCWVEKRVEDKLFLPGPPPPPPREAGFPQRGGG